jgi:hypothetical protein
MLDRYDITERANPKAASGRLSRQPAALGQLPNSTAAAGQLLNHAAAGGGGHPNTRWWWSGHVRVLAPAWINWYNAT